uniref:Uncharacterized protein n=1 Tax=Arundo donax TaxID=35708 RepID=A0A0A9FYQ9_ARUDO
MGSWGRRIERLLPPRWQRRQRRGLSPSTANWRRRVLLRRPPMRQQMRRRLNWGRNRKRRKLARRWR